MKQHSLRYSDDLHEAVERARGDVPRNTFVVRALEAAVGSCRHVDLDPKVTPEVEENFGAIVAAVNGGSSHRCPVSGCGFSAKSPKARCPSHGRTVVPV